MQHGLYDPTKPFNEQIREIIQDTHPKEGPLIVVPHGKRFRKIKDWNHWRNYDDLDSSDSICTKGLIHWLMDTLENGVQDSFAMSANDLMEGGFIPSHLVDNILIQEESEEKIFRLARKLRDLCIQNPWETPDGKSYPIAITGGDTSIKNTLQGFDMIITATGYVRKGEEIASHVEEGDAIIGLGSNGLHSNGYTPLREELFDKRHMKIDDMLPYGVTVGEELTKPTHLYMPAIKELIKYLREYIHGMVHITGGGLSKLRELLPDEGHVDIAISKDHRLKRQEIFNYISCELGWHPEKMYKTFNNGIGYAIGIRGRAKEALGILRKYFPSEVIGLVVPGNGKVFIESQYQPITVQF